MNSPEVSTVGTADAIVVVIALANDHEVVVRGLEHMLAPYRDRVRVAELNVEMPPHQSVDLTLYDTFAMPQTNDDHLDEVLRNPKSGRVVLYSWNTQPELIRAALDKGAVGYLSKTMDSASLVSALQRIHAGESVVAVGEDQQDVDEQTRAQVEKGQLWPGQELGLTPRESEVLCLITLGLSNEEIARRSYLSINTIKTYIRSGYRRIGVDSRAKAVIWGMNNGMAPDQVRIVRSDQTR